MSSNHKDRLINAFLTFKSQAKANILKTGELLNTHVKKVQHMQKYADYRDQNEKTHFKCCYLILFVDTYTSNFRECNEVDYLNSHWFSIHRCVITLRNKYCYGHDPRSPSFKLALNLKILNLFRKTGMEKKVLTDFK